MRKLFALQLLMFVSCGLFAQKNIKGHYTPSAGILGSGSFGNFRTGGNNPMEIDYKMSFGYTAGAWVSFPVGNFVSIEPQFLYSSYAYEAETLPEKYLNGSISYLSVPLAIKLHVAPKFAIIFGPQIDFKQNVSDDNNLYFEEDFNNTSVAVFGGVEVFPRGRFTIFARYLYGISDMNKAENSLSTVSLYNQQIQLGLKWRIFGGRFIPADTDGDGIPDPKDKCPNQVGLERYEGCPIPDTDADGINDEQDKCPTVPGLPKYNGCPIPDTDKDGINDEVDKCPSVAGLPKYQGCPIPDGDKDGVNDEEDKCPTVAGLPKYQGCPIPDTDGDGINDEDDRCPNVPGTAEMRGCPTLAEFQGHEVSFATGKAVLTAQGKKELDIVVAFMKREKDVKMKLDGYTDNTGSDKVNIPLSKARAEAAKKYLVSQGIEESRLTTEGFGSANPVKDNKTAKGRSENRRVDVRVQ